MDSPPKKLHQFSAKKPCYYCGSAPPVDGKSDAEHVPPRMLFKGVLCDHITVPSCPKHNSHKSGTDTTVVSAVAMMADWIFRNRPDSPLLTPNVS